MQKNKPYAEQLRAQQAREYENIVTNGINRAMTRIACFLVAWMIMGFIVNALPFWRDSTDPESGRSGLRIKTDSFTGCQYLESTHGLTPRLDRSGKQICDIALTED